MGTRPARRGSGSGASVLDHVTREHGLLDIVTAATATGISFCLIEAFLPLPLITSRAYPSTDEHELGVVLEPRILHYPLY